MAVKVNIKIIIVLPRKIFKYKNPFQLLKTRNKMQHMEMDI